MANKTIVTGAEGVKSVSVGAPASAPVTVKVEALGGEGVGEMWHGGKRIEPGHQVEMSQEEAARHVEAKHARIVTE